MHCKFCPLSFIIKTMLKKKDYLKLNGLVYELSSKNVNEKEEEIELKLDKEKQKLIQLATVKDDKTFSKSKKENYKIGAVISNQK